MKRIAISILAALPIAAAACDSVSVQVLPFEPAVEYRPVAAISSMAPAAPRAGAVVTRATARMEGCTLVVGYADPVIVVARELKQCGREHVLEHELEHVRIYRAALATLSDRITARGATLEAAREEVLAVYAQHRALDAEDNHNDVACGRQVARLYALL